MARNKQESDAPDEDPGVWLMTLADMFSLLLCFFIMLFALTYKDEEKYVGMLTKMGDALGGKSQLERKSGLDVVSENMQKFLKDNNLLMQVNLTSDSRGVSLYAEGDMFFDAGSAELKPEIKRLLRRIAEIIRATPYKVIVEGHTDDTQGVMDKYPSNWELSSARASSVVRHFIDEEGIEPYRFSAEGYAGFRPKYALIPENRSRNRRVEIIISREKM
jgi:chemotaxis protein MotB